MIKDEYNVIGVMSGTSLDGVDLIYTQLSLNKTWDFKIIHTQTINYTKSWFNILKGLVGLTPGELKKIDADYTVYLASIINTFISSNNIKKIDAICSHGHTALHQPENYFTYQIGNLPILATLLKQTVVCDFRVQDVALKGQGAPLVPIGDALLFSKYDYCLNLGGFANISYDENGLRKAYDICPVNIVLNLYAEKLGHPFDNKGMFAASGTSVPNLSKKLNALDFYNTSAPKSLGLEWVNRCVLPIIEASNYSKIEDVLHTFTRHIALQISKVVKAKSSILITGGGAYNNYLIACVKEIKDLNVVIPSKDVLEFKEALIFAFLGVLKLREETNCLKSVTGALKDHSSGKIYFN